MSSTFRFAAALATVGAMCVSAAWAQQRDDQSSGQATGKSTVQPRPAASKAAQGNAPRAGTQTSGQPQAGAQPRTANKPVADQQIANPDHFIAASLRICSEEEVALGQFAAEHSENKQVQKFADMMIKEHSELAQDLAKWAPDASLGVAIAGNRGKSGEAATARTVRTDQSDNAAGKSFDILAVRKKIAMRCLESSKKELGSKEGSDFDKCYVGQQIVLHQQMIEKASVLRDYASPDLQASIDKGLDGAKEHLDHAKQLVEKLSGGEKRETRTRASDSDSSDSSE